MLTLETLFDEEFYLSQNLGVEEAIADGTFPNAFEHFGQYGQFEGRAPNPLFDTAYYLSVNSDVGAEVAAGTTTAVAHFVNFGQFENRTPNPFFDPIFYVEQHPFIATAVVQGIVTPFEHFLKAGQFEGLDPGPLFDTEFYRSRNPDAVLGVEEEIIGSLFEHFYRFGLEVGRLGIPPGPAEDLGGAIALDTLLGSRTVVESVGDADSVDIYEFVIPNFASQFSLFLNGLQADVEVELIQDFNQNQAIEATEIFASSNNFGLAAESIDIDVLETGTYFIRVSQVEGETDYALNLFVTPLDLPPETTV